MSGDIRVHIHCYRHDDIEGVIVSWMGDIQVTSFQHVNVQGS